MIDLRHIVAIIKFAVSAASVKALFWYLDPGSGSLLIQLLVAAIVGVLATFRFWKSRIMTLFGRRDESEEESDAVERRSSE